MIRFYLFTSLLISSLCTFGQQYTNYTQYTLNRFEINPAVAGLQPCATTTFGTRIQWAGFDNAPRTYFASFHTRINRQVKYPKNFHGVGGSFSNDRSGFNEKLNLRFAYAYHMKLSKNYHASIGVFAGVKQYKINYDLIRIPNLATDPVFNNQEEKTIFYPEISPGGFLYNRNFYLGLSMLQLYPVQTGKFGTSENRLTGHYFFSGGYRFRTKTLHYIPSLLFNFSPVITPTLDLTMTVEYKNKISLAVGSKYLNSGYATLQLNMGAFSVGYSYEYALTELAKVAPTTQEIVIQINTCSFKEDKHKFLCPAYQ